MGKQLSGLSYGGRSLASSTYRLGKINMTEAEARAKAQSESRNGYVQHVNRKHHAGEDYYVVSDWADTSTVASYEDGKEL